MKENSFLSFFCFDDLTEHRNLYQTVGVKFPDPNLTSGVHNKESVLFLPLGTRSMLCIKEKQNQDFTDKNKQKQKRHTHKKKEKKKKKRKEKGRKKQRKEQFG